MKHRKQHIFTAWTPSSFDDTMGERDHFTGQKITRSDRSSIRTDLRSNFREKSFAFISQFLAQWRRCRCCWKSLRAT